MTEMGILNFLQTGTPTGYALCAIGVYVAWKMSALIPTLIDTWEKRSTGIEARLQASMVAYTERMDNLLADADNRYKELERHHVECREEQEVLRARIGQQDLTIATQNKTIADQSATIVKLSDEMSGLRRSNLQAQITMVEERDNLSPAMKRSIVKLKEIK